MLFSLFLFQNILQKSSVSLTTLLYSEPILGPREGALTAGPVGGAVGPSDVSVRAPDALKAARLFVRESVGCVPGLATCKGQGAPLGALPERPGPVPGSL